MLTYFEGTVIKRFTYDWLIRFAELHPFEVTNRMYDDNYLPLPSKYVSISPLFTTLINRYMPEFSYGWEYLQVPANTFPLLRKYKIHVFEICELDFRTTQMMTYFIKSRFIFYTKNLSIFSTCGIAPADLKYMLKQHKYDEIFIYTVLTEPMQFSELWPLIGHCKAININIKNLIYGKNVVNIMRKNQLCLTTLIFSQLDLSQKEVLDLFDFVLSLPNRPFHVCFSCLQNFPISLANDVIEKYEALGLNEEMYAIPQDQFSNMQCVETNGLLFARFYE